MTTNPGKKANGDREGTEMDQLKIGLERAFSLDCLPQIIGVEVTNGRERAGERKAIPVYLILPSILLLFLVFNS
jgi:hypothetical protein